jgi:hypothetical protein
MNNDGRTTSEQLYIPSLLVVGGSQSLLLRCFHASKPMGLAIKACTPADAIAIVAGRRPLAIVVPNDVVGAAEHDDLAIVARDVKSKLFAVDPEVSVRELEAMIAAAVGDGFRQRERRGGAGCYSIVEGVEDEAPFSRRTLPPEPGGEARSSRPPTPGLASTRASVPPVSVRAASDSSSRPSVPPLSVRARSDSLPRASIPPVSSRPSAPPVSTRPSVVDAPPRPSAPPVSRTVPSLTAPAPPESVPPVSGVQKPAVGAFAAIRSVFSSRR